MYYAYLHYAAHLKAPKWYKRPVGVSFGFGGKLVSFHPKSAVGGASTGSEVCIAEGVRLLLLFTLSLIDPVLSRFWYTVWSLKRVW